MFDIDIKEIVTIGAVLFALIDVVGNIPIFLKLKLKYGSIEAGKASIVSGIIMIVFLFIGEEILKYIGIDVSSFAIAGSVVIFLLALEMILGVHIYKADESSSASIFPIAFPLIAGTGTLTTLLSLRSSYYSINIIIAILINVVIVYFFLKMCTRIEKILGINGIEIIRRIFGVILLAIAVKLFATNVKGLL